MGPTVGKRVILVVEEAWGGVDVVIPLNDEDEGGKEWRERGEEERPCSGCCCFGELDKSEEVDDNAFVLNG